MQGLGFSCCLELEEETLSGLTQTGERGSSNSFYALCPHISHCWPSLRPLSDPMFGGRGPCSPQGLHVFGLTVAILRHRIRPKMRQSMVSPLSIRCQSNVNLHPLFVNPRESHQKSITILWKSGHGDAPEFALYKINW